ncbi:MAG: hypothetical protein AAF841_08745 [Pseudomonadota bacterium]
MQPTRLSFLRVLMRKLSEMNATVTRPLWEMSDKGHGRAVYTIRFAGRAYSLVAFSQALADEERTDRVIATKWDAAFVLFDGVPDDADLARLAHNVPLQEAGRLGPRDLVLSRANKSVRLFEHVVQALRAGRQPDKQMIRDTGYLMRTTAVYGNGKFGLADRETFAKRDGLTGPFAAEMLTVWLIRAFTHDLAEHLGGAPIDRALKRHLGIGNATGLGMAPFLVSHPMLLDAWFRVRETALARVLALGEISEEEAEALMKSASEAGKYLSSWRVSETDAQAEIDALAGAWSEFRAGFTKAALLSPGGLRRVFAKAKAHGTALEELAAAWLLEPFGALIDDLAEAQATDATPELDAAMTCRALKALIEENCAWALECDFESPEAQAQFWYVSEEKLEPRLGLRGRDAGCERETPLDSARQFNALHEALPAAETPLWRFLAEHPEHRAAARRAQMLAHHPYAEVRANLLAQEAAPIHLLRAKLSFFGATRFDPKSRLWTRVTLAQGLPLHDEIGRESPWLPVI